MSAPRANPDHHEAPNPFEPDPESHAAFADWLATKRTAGHKPAPNPNGAPK